MWLIIEIDLMVFSPVFFTSSKILILAEVIDVQLSVPLWDSVNARTIF